MSKENSCHLFKNKNIMRSPCGSPPASPSECCELMLCPEQKWEQNKNQSLSPSLFNSNFKGGGKKEKESSNLSLKHVFVFPDKENCAQDKRQKHTEQTEEHWNDPYRFIKTLRSRSSVSFQSPRKPLQQYRDYFGYMVILLITHVKIFTWGVILHWPI